MIYLKLGGSLITDKTRPFTAHIDIIERIAGEIAAARKARPELQLLIGHGSGSFGHAVAQRYHTHEGASTPADWRGFAHVWRAARALNEILMSALVEKELPALAFPPSASAICDEGEIIAMAHVPIARALQAGLLPVTYGDVAFDRRRGSTIVSTERVFLHLAAHIPPTRILLAGRAEGVMEPSESGLRLLKQVSQADLARLDLGETAGVDVTGGMGDKVAKALQMRAALAFVEVRIFSGVQPGSIQEALLGARPGTAVV